MKLGLHHMDKTRALVLHMLPEMLIVASILCHEIVEQLTGLYRTNETEVESVPMAIERIFNKKSKDIRMSASKAEEMKVGADNDAEHSPLLTQVDKVKSQDN